MDTVKTAAMEYKFFEGNDNQWFKVPIYQTLDLPFLFDGETIIKVEFHSQYEYFDIAYDENGKKLVVTGKKLTYGSHSTHPMTEVSYGTNMTVETDKKIYKGNVSISVGYAEEKPDYQNYKDLNLEIGKTVSIPLPSVQGEMLTEYTAISVERWVHKGDSVFIERVENPEEILGVNFSEDYRTLILTAKQELTEDIRVHAQIVTDDYTCYHVARYKVSTGESMNNVYLSAQNPTWMVGANGVDGKDYPGIAVWDNDNISEADKEAVVQSYSRVYRDGEYLGYFNSSSYREKLDLRRFFDKPGEYIFQTVFTKDNSQPIDIPDQYWSEFSEPYEYNPPAKKMSTPKNLKWMPDGSMTWDKVEETYDSPSNHRYVGFIYRSNLGDHSDENQRLETYFVSSSGRMDPVNLDTTYDYVFNVVAYGDLVNYANSEPSEYSELHSPELVVEQSNTLINGLKDGNVKDNIENTELSEDEKGTLKQGIQTSENVAKNYAELEELYKTSKTEAGESVDFEIEADDSVKDSAKFKVVGGILNGAAGIKLEKPSNETLNNSNVTKYRRKSAINISLTGDFSGELKYPVLITMPVPSGISPAKLIIVHVKHDESIETIEPRINSDGSTASFAVTEFSTFFFVDSSSTGGSGSSGGGGGGGSSFSGTSAAGTVTTDAKKGRVNSLTGIIIGSGDGYSKWISETPQG